MQSAQMRSMGRLPPNTPVEKLASLHPKNAMLVSPLNPHLRPPRTANTLVVTALMSRNPTESRQPKAPALGATRRPFDSRDGLGAYLTDPASFPPSIVIYHTPKFVVINDRYPKSSVHVLVLPRDPSKFSLHPYDAFGDPVFRAEALAEVAKVKTL